MEARFEDTFLKGLKKHASIKKLVKKKGNYSAHHRDTEHTENFQKKLHEIGRTQRFSGKNTIFHLHRSLSVISVPSVPLW
jgi:hypothetical protein